MWRWPPLGIALVLLAPRAAGAWSPADHRRIAAEAARHVPPELASFLQDNLDDVLRGSVDPDRRFMDSPNHSYDVDDGAGENPRHVAYLASALASMIRNGAPREKVAYWFGALAHYVSDIDQPLHTSERDRREALYHPLFEALGCGFEARARILGIEVDIRVGKALSGWEFQHDGELDAIEDVERWQIENARWASPYYQEIRKFYRKARPFEGARLKEIYRTCIDEAIDDVIDLWAHVHRSTGGGTIDLPPGNEVLSIELDRD